MCVPAKKQLEDFRILTGYNIQVESVFVSKSQFKTTIFRDYSLAPGYVPYED